MDHRDRGEQHLYGRLLGEAGVQLVQRPLSDADEWLEADGLGGFASGTASGIATRRYHALLLAATQPPSGRMVLVNAVEAWAETEAGRLPLSTHRYAPDAIHPDARPQIVAFDARPWPRWRFAIGDGLTVEHEVVVLRDSGETVLRWTRAGGDGPCRLEVRPLLSGRDYHALHHENLAFRFAADVQGGGRVCWRPYEGVPAVAALTNGHYAHAPEWFRNFRYAAETARGLDDTEDLASPGVFTFDLAAGPAMMVLRCGDGLTLRVAPYAAASLAAERKRREGEASLASVASYVVDRGEGRTIIAGFPWFGDWGRDTFIAMRGLLIATGRLDEAERILLAWAATVSEGMLPNRFPDDGGAPEYNTVDAALWFTVACHALEQARGRANDVLRDAVDRIVAGYAAGTRFGIAADADGLLRAGVPGQQLTWMDARIGERVVTPRIGKPVEVQALWVNALRIAGRDDLAAGATASFCARFPDATTGGLVDVVDEDHVAGRTDARIRPNQILAVGGLPFPLLEGEAAAGVLRVVEAHLLTPMGLRTLAPSDPAYAGRYGGDPSSRDGAYHQGTVWPWLIGPFVEAWLRVNGDGAALRAEASRRFLAPLRAHLDVAGIGHVSEVADGDPPHAPGGCPFQAWSLGEFLRTQTRLGRTCVG